MCARIKPRNYKRKRVTPLPIATRAWEEIAIDFIPQLPESSGYTRLAVVMDRFSKEIILIPCTDSVTAEEFAVLYRDYVWRYRGWPNVIWSDHDTLFVSAFWQELLVQTGTKQNLAPPFHHQANGQVERGNQVIEAMLILSLFGT